MSVSYPFLIVNLWYGVGALSSPFFKMSQNPEQTIAELQQKIKSLELQLKKAKDSSGYGLKWEEKPEIFEERAQNALPLLKEDKSLLIDNKSDLDHIIIEWDNYHALSALNYTHKWMIDVIYIDPPYNTGNKDFIYNDNYVDPEDTYRHSKWLSFISKRLKLAKKLLTENGVIFISIDDNEQANLSLLCDDIFWENNFIANLIWEKSHAPKNNSKIISTKHEYVLCYAKNKDNVRFTLNPRTEKSDKDYKNPDNDPRWVWSRWSMLAPWYTEKNRFEIVFANWKRYMPWEWKCWRYSKEMMLQLEQENRISFEPNMPRLKKFLSDMPDWIVPETILYFKDVWHWQDANTEIYSLFWDKIFEYPKPTWLIKFLISKHPNKSATILDFFAWSWTTWHALLNLNKEDWWHRQFILCSNRENTKEEPEKNICKNITYERVKRVLKWYTNSKGEKMEWLWWWNLRYYTTEFIEKKKSTDDLRQSFIYLCDELLCIKEDTFNEYKSELLSDKLKCYQKNNHYTVILYDIREIGKLQQLLSTLNGKISVYIFSLSKDSCEEELQEFSEKITIENIPDDILETYKKIF